MERIEQISYINAFIEAMAGTYTERTKFLFDLMTKYDADIRAKFIMLAFEEDESLAFHEIIKKATDDLHIAALDVISIDLNNLSDDELSKIYDIIFWRIMHLIRGIRRSIKGES